MSPPVAFWLGLVKEYYDKDTHAATVDIPTLRAIGETRLTNPKHSPAILAVLDSLPADSSPANIASVILANRRRNLILELAALGDVGDRKKSDKLFQELNSIWDKEDVADAPSELEYAKDWSELDSIVGRDKRISTGLNSLDVRIGGGVLPGHHILLFGRTEVGKSCLSIALAANLLRSGQRVLYVGNEENINVLKARMRLSLLHQPQTWVDHLPKKSARLLQELVGDRLTMVSLTPGSISELEDLTEKHTPTVLVVDQVRNLSGSEDGMTQRLEHNAIRLRSLLNKQHTVGISVTQAGDRSQGHNQDGPIYLSAGDVDSSRVGLPGTVDLMLGVGVNRELLSRNLRMISFAKNKLSADANAREPLLLRFDFTTSSVYDD